MNDYGPSVGPTGGEIAIQDIQRGDIFWFAGKVLWTAKGDAYLDRSVSPLIKVVVQRADGSLAERVWDTLEANTRPPGLTRPVKR